MEREFGSRMYQASFVVMGDVSQNNLGSLVQAIVSSIGMTTFYGPEVHHYPAQGRGGVGFSYYQPIVESFIVADSYTDIDTAYIVVCSCMFFTDNDVEKVIKSHGLELVESMNHVLVAPSRKKVAA